ncbi:Isc1 [Symbiodinium sp. CCMP2456]|nr:Isc1 [Symbiodinium sp. CCMP2456]
MASPTLRTLSGLPGEPTPLKDSALVIIDAQQTYREGVMKLEGVEPALEECAALLKRARAEGATVVHIQHDAGEGSPYDLTQPVGQIAEPVAPVAGEEVIVKKVPNSFHDTTLHQYLQDKGVKSLVLCGFMAHMCVNSTARGAFNLGYASTVVASATATRSLADPITGEPVEAALLKKSALTAISDVFAVIVPTADKLP